jgi:hypothetical protein
VCTAQHVAEKYLQLARDAQSSGDHVMAESYLQHAEHYFRIIAAAQQAQQQAQMGGTPRPPGETDEDNDDDVDYGLSDRFASVAERLPPQPVYQAANFQPPQPQGNFGGQPQPYGERPRFSNNDRQERPNYNGGERNERWRNDRQPQERPYQDRPYQDRNAERGNYQGQPYQDRGNRGDQRRFRGDRPERGGEGQNESRGSSEREPAELPAFITAPGPRASFPEPEGNAPEGDASREFGGEGGGFHLRSRRRRRGRPDEAEGRSPNDVPDADEVPASE